MIELHEAADRPFVCPTCKKTARVVPKTWPPGIRTRPVTEPFWLMTACDGFCGKVCRKRNERVELIPTVEQLEARP